jgi:tripartite-type tricarboxylate transporter receptor subunit TctC
MQDLQPMMRLIRIFVGLIALGVSVPAIGQAYPSKVVRIIVPYPPGGTVDAVARVVAQSLSEQLGQQFIVENKPGANGTIGSDFVAKAKPDGHTLLVQASTIVTNPLFLKTVPYDVTRDFTPLSNLGSVPLLVTAHPSLPASNLREFIDTVRTKPAKYAFGHSSLGSASHLAEEAIKRDAKLDILIVPYKGTGAVITDLLGGHVNAFIDAMPSSYPLVQSGKVKPLAVTTSKRTPLLPNVPTVAESGLPGFEMVSWYGVWGPAKLPKELAQRISAEVAKAIRSPLASQRLGEQGFQAVGSTPEEFEAYIKSEVSKYAQIVKDANIKPE